MAAEYILHTKTHLHKDDILNLFNKLHWTHVQEKISETSTLFSFNDTIGFNLYFNVRKETGFEIEGYTYGFTNAITFRFVNGSDFLKTKKKV